MIVPATPPHDDDNEVTDQGLNAQTERKPQSQDEPSASSKESEDLLADDGEEWRESTMLFFAPPIIATNSALHRK